MMLTIRLIHVLNTLVVNNETTCSAFQIFTIHFGSLARTIMMLLLIVDDDDDDGDNIREMPKRLGFL